MLACRKMRFEPNESKEIRWIGPLLHIVARNRKRACMLPGQRDRVRLVTAYSA